MKEKINKLTMSAFSEVTGYSTQQLSNYQKRENQDKFKFFSEDNQIFVLCTNAELRNYRKNMKSNTIEAEAEKTAAFLENLKKEISNITENFSKDIKQEFEKIDERQTKAIESINNRIISINTNNESVTLIAQSFSKITKDFLDVSQKISTEHSEYKELLKDIDTKYNKSNDIIQNTVKATEDINYAQSQIEITIKRFNKSIEDNIIKVNNNSLKISELLESITDVKTETEKKEKENYFKKYLLPIIIPSVIIFFGLIITFFSYEKIIYNQEILDSKIETKKKIDTNNDDPFSNKKKNYKK